jgi:hypothetical protein
VVGARSAGIRGGEDGAERRYVSTFISKPVGSLYFFKLLPVCTTNNLMYSLIYVTVTKEMNTLNVLLLSI